MKKKKSLYQYMHGGYKPKLGGGGAMLGIIDSIAGAVNVPLEMLNTGEDIDPDAYAGSLQEKTDKNRKNLETMSPFPGMTALAGTFGQLVESNKWVHDYQTGQDFATTSPVQAAFSGILNPMGNKMDKIAEKDWLGLGMSFVPGGNMLYDALKQKATNRKAEYSKKWNNKSMTQQRAVEGAEQRSTTDAKQDLYQASQMQPVATGGKIVGPGGKHDDAIETLLEPGSFVMTPEGAKKAKKDGAFDAIGMNPEQPADIPRTNGEGNVEVSNTEVLLDPLQLQMLVGSGYNPNKYIDEDSQYKVKKGGKIGLENGGGVGNIVPENINIYDYLGLDDPTKSSFNIDPMFKQNESLIGMTTPTSKFQTPLQDNTPPPFNRGLPDYSPQAGTIDYEFGRGITPDKSSIDTSQIPSDTSLIPPSADGITKAAKDPIKQARNMNIATSAISGAAGLGELIWTATRKNRNLPKPSLIKPKKLNIDTQGIEAKGRQMITEQALAASDMLMRQGLGKAGVPAVQSNVNKAVNDLVSNINMTKQEEAKINTQIENQAEQQNVATDNQFKMNNTQFQIQQDQVKGAMQSKNLGKIQDVFTNAMNNRMKITAMEQYDKGVAGSSGYSRYNKVKGMYGYPDVSEAEYYQSLKRGFFIGPDGKAISADKLFQ